MGSNTMQFFVTYEGVTKNAPTLIMQRGVNYTFEDGTVYSSTGAIQLKAFDEHPMYLTDSASQGGFTGQLLSKLMQSNGKPSTKLVLTTEGGPQDLMCPPKDGIKVVKMAYQCSIHTLMGGLILIVPQDWKGANSTDQVDAAPIVEEDEGSCSSKGFELTLLKNYRMKWRINKETKEDGSTGVPISISFDIEADDILPNYGGFLGLGFGVTMIDTDLITMQLDENAKPVVTDSYTYSFQPFPDTDVDATNDIRDVNGTFNAVTGIATFNFTRLLNTGDEFDYAIGIDEDTQIIYSHGSSQVEGLQYHGLNRRGKGEVNFFTGQASLIRDDSYNLNLVHGISMLFAWLFMYPLGGFIARYCKHFNHWLTAHELAQKFGSFGAVSFAGMAIISSRTHLKTAHSVIGVAITTCLIFQIMLGEFSKWRIRTWKARWYHRPIAKCHKYIGFFLITFGPYQVKLGIEVLWPHDELAINLYWVAVGFLCAAFISAETYKRVNAYLHERTSRKIHDLVSMGADSSNSGVHGGAAHLLLNQKTLKRLPSYTWQQVALRIKSGSKWLVISGVVLDVKVYLDSHPGGRTILEEALGTDSTMAFFGEDLAARSKGEDDEGHGDHDDGAPHMMTVHAHSAFAWRKLESLAVGKLLIEDGEDDLGHGAVGPMRDLHDTQSMKLSMQSNRRANLPRLLAERRVQSKAPIGAAANYRTYRLVSRKWANQKKDVIVIRFDQSSHERPFIWPDVFDPSGNDVSVSISDSAGSSQDVNNLHSPSKDAPFTPASAVNMNRRSSLMQRAVQSMMQVAAGNMTLADLARRATTTRRGSMVFGQLTPSAKQQAQPQSSTTAQPSPSLPHTPTGSGMREGGDQVPFFHRPPSNNNIPSAMPQPPSDSARDPNVTPLRRPASLPQGQANHSGTDGAAFSAAVGRNLGPATAPVTNGHSRQSGAHSRHASLQSPTKVEAFVPAFGLRERRKRNSKRASNMQMRPKAHNLLPGEHVELTALIDADHVERYYTPVPCDSEDAFELVIKVYELGTMTSWLANQRLGSYVKIRGPTGAPLLPMNARGQVAKDAGYPYVAMIAGGAGLTPFLGVINYYLLLNERKTVAQRSRLALLYFSRSEEDIIFASHLDDLAAASDGYFTVTYALTGPIVRPGWNGERGRVNSDMVARFLSALAPPEEEDEGWAPLGSDGSNDGAAAVTPMPELPLFVIQPPGRLDHVQEERSMTRTSEMTHDQTPEHVARHVDHTIAVSSMGLGLGVRRDSDREKGRSASPIDLRPDSGSNSGRSRRVPMFLSSARSEKLETETPVETYAPVTPDFSPVGSTRQLPAHVTVVIPAPNAVAHPNAIESPEMAHARLPAAVHVDERGSGSGLKSGRSLLNPVTDSPLGTKSPISSIWSRRLNKDGANADNTRMSGLTLGDTAMASKRSAVATSAVSTLTQGETSPARAGHPSPSSHTVGTGVATESKEQQEARENGVMRQKSNDTLASKPVNLRRATSRGLALFTGEAQDATVVGSGFETPQPGVVSAPGVPPVQPRIYCCGPTDFLKSCLGILQDMDVNMEVVDCL
jgi:NAD(P)H-flavin reductase